MSENPSAPVEPFAFDPPHHFPLVLRPRSLYADIPITKLVPCMAGFIGSLGAIFALASGADITESANLMFSTASMGGGALLYLFHKRCQYEDRQIGAIFHTVDLTENHLIVTSRDRNGIRQETAIKTDGLSASIVHTKDESAAYIRLDTKDDSLLISTPLSPQEARQVAMMINQAAQYTNVTYHQREDVRREAEMNFRLAFPELQV